MLASHGSAMSFTCRSTGSWSIAVMKCPRRSTWWPVRASAGVEVEAEAVDVHLGDPVAQRVQDHPQRRGVGRVDGVAAAGDVEVGRPVGDPVDVLVVADVVEAAEAQRRAERAALGGVVVDHVEDHLEAGARAAP